jgi:Asp-tRNA(Asn)/Glu-tRNA(Gln) amidotransferase A subunit family amidase
MGIPTGSTPTGMPLAMQFIAERCNELALLIAAHWSEQVLGPNLTPSCNSADRSPAQAQESQQHPG